MRTALIATSAITLFRSRLIGASLHCSPSGACFTHLAFGHRPKGRTAFKATSRSMTAESTENNNNIEMEDNIPPLRFLGDEKLMQKQPAVTVEELRSEEFQAKLNMLPRAMKKYGGIGIAAPQVGWWTSVFCFGIDGTNPRYPKAQSIPLGMWINPKITWSSPDKNWMWEGCLSVPGMRGWVERPVEVIMEGMDEKGQAREPQHLKGLAARVAQHELDHLDGVLFTHCVPNQTFLVPQASMNARDGWAPDWPSKGSYETALGDLSDEK